MKFYKPASKKPKRLLDTISHARRAAACLVGFSWKEGVVNQTERVLYYQSLDENDPSARLWLRAPMVRVDFYHCGSLAEVWWQELQRAWSALAEELKEPVDGKFYPAFFKADALETALDFAERVCWGGKNG